MSVKGMTFYHVNTRSIFNKLNQMDILFNDVDVLCCTETWLDNRFSNEMVSLPRKTVFRMDRRNDVIPYNNRPTAGGVCIYINNLLSNYTARIDACSAITSDFEVITLSICRPNHRYLSIICVYKPPKGSIANCIKFLNSVVGNKEVAKKEIWILGDLNTDLLKRDDRNTVMLQAFAKKAGLLQVIDCVTRPNVRGGSCIDLIMSNCPFLSKSGVLPDMISDHYPIYAIRKKRREDCRVSSEYVRDYKNFNENVFCQLLDNLDWQDYYFEPNPENQWRFLHDGVMNILSVMCPYKKVFTRIVKKRWLTQEIYSLIRSRKCLVKRYNLSKDQNLLQDIRTLRNQINSCIERAKSVYIQNILGNTKRDPKKFWRTIRSMYNDTDTPEFIIFKDQDRNVNIEHNEAPNFVNKFFAEIADRVCSRNDTRPFIPGERIDKLFLFTPPEQYEIMLFAENIDMTSSSGIKGINAKMCKIIMLHNYTGQNTFALR